MNQRGFSQLIVLIALLAISSVGVTGFLYLNKKSEPTSSPTPTISPSPSPSNTNQPSALPTSSNKSKATQSSPIPAIRTPSPEPNKVTTPAPTIVPTPVPTPASTPLPKPSCSLTAIPSNGVAPLQASICVVNTSNPSQGIQTEYVDYNGDGNWDYQGSQYGCHPYTYQSSGNYTPKAKIVGDHWGESDPCQATVTIN